MQDSLLFYVSSIVSLYRVSELRAEFPNLGMLKDRDNAGFSTLLCIFYSILVQGVRT